MSRYILPGAPFKVERVNSKGKTVIQVLQVTTGEVKLETEKYSKARDYCDALNEAWSDGWRSAKKGELV